MAVPSAQNAANPLEDIVAQLAAVERGLSTSAIRAVVEAAVVSRTTRRRVAEELRVNPQVLRTGRGPSIWSVGKILAALAKAGARQLATPRCCECDREITSLYSRMGGLWACSSCGVRNEACTRCGQVRRVVSRDREGRPCCGRCHEYEDPTQDLVGAVLAQHADLTERDVRAALDQCSARASVRRRVAWTVLDHPGLLTGIEADARTPSVGRFTNALTDTGASTITQPLCPLCGLRRRLRGKVNGQRVCAMCDEHSRAVACARCGKVRKPGYRDENGRPVCSDCLRTDPVSRERCTGCGHARIVKARTEDGPWCGQCSPREDQECSICGRRRRCLMSQATGKPWCTSCRQTYARCSFCRTVAPLRGGTRQAPLCARCVNPDPSFWGRCPRCARTWQFGSQPCQRCRIDRRMSELLGADGDGAPARFEEFRHALVSVERPDHAMLWLSKPKVRDLLHRLASERRAVTHEVLDELPASKTLDYLRALLVASGTLHPRDERLVRLEHWAHVVIDARENADERRLLHGYAIWHHLRRLRRRLRDHSATPLQVTNVRTHVKAAVEFLGFLGHRGSSLGTCTQAELDDFLANAATYPQESANFVRWAVGHRHAADLSAPAERWPGPDGRHDQEGRWAAARRLMHDDTVATADRVAGLLLLLYAQRVNTITGLTTDHVIERDGRVRLRLGNRPVALLPPLDALVKELVATRRSTALIGDPGRWLFPGRSPGRPLSDGQVSTRLRAIGLRPRQDRNTALFTLASQVPAPILARKLGVHIAVAVQWQRASGGDWAAYAADVASGRNAAARKIAATATARPAGPATGAST